MLVVERFTDHICPSLRTDQVKSPSHATCAISRPDTGRTCGCMCSVATLRPSMSGANPTQRSQFAGARRLFSPCSRLRIWDYSMNPRNFKGPLYVHRYAYQNRRISQHPNIYNICFTPKGNSGPHYSPNHGVHRENIFISRCTGKHYHHLWARLVEKLSVIGTHLKYMVCYTYFIIHLINIQCYIWSLLSLTAQTTDLSAQNALDLLLNMSNARELQVLYWHTHIIYWNIK